MQCAQSAGLDLPLKVLAWQDAAGKVWLSYNDPVWMTRRHGAADCGEVPARMRGALDDFARHATTQ